MYLKNTYNSFNPTYIKEVIEIFDIADEKFIGIMKNYNFIYIQNNKGEIGAIDRIVCYDNESSKKEVVRDSKKEMSTNDKYGDIKKIKELLDMEQ